MCASRPKWRFCCDFPSFYLTPGLTKYSIIQLRCNDNMTTVLTVVLGQPLT